MRSAGPVAVLAMAMAAAAAAAQQVPRTVSPRLARALLAPDSEVVVWVIAQPAADLGRVARAVSAAGGRIRHLSRFVHAVSARLPAGAIRGLAALPEVRRIQLVAVYIRPADETRGNPYAPQREGANPPARGEPDSSRPPARALARAAAVDTLYGADFWVARQLNVIELHRRGLRGAGVRLAMLDAGFNTRHPFMSGATIVAQRDFVYNDSVVRDQPGEAQGEMSHGTGTWSLIAANAPGRLFGLANQARFLLAKTEFTPTETRIEEDHWVAGVEWAESLGVDIISSSLGYLTFDDKSGYTASQLNGDVGVTTLAADSAAARGTLVVVAIGNLSLEQHTMGTPADAKGIVAVGATDSLQQVVAFSARGPTADGRIKPEVVAPGSHVTVAAIDTQLTTLTDTALTVSSGTSFSTPLVAGIAALVQGTRPGRPAAELRAGLLAASDASLSPDNNHGYGIPNALALLAFPTGLRVLGPTDSTLTTVTPAFSWDAGSPPAGEVDTFRLRVGTDPTLTSPILDTTLAATSVTVLRAQRPGTRLWWRLAARSSLAVAESTAVLGPLVVPPWVTLRTLASPQGQSIRDSLPLFAWSSPAVSAPAGPFTYDVAVYPASRDPSQAVASASGLADTTFRPAAPLEKNLPFRWRVVARLGADSVVATSPGTFVVLDESAPAATLLFQNFPNPFPNAALGVATTCVWFDVADRGQVELDIFDLRGRRVRRLAPAADVPPVLPAGRYGRPPGDATGTCDPRFAWDGRDEAGAYVRPGVYLYRLTASGFRDSKRLVFLGAP